MCRFPDVVGGYSVRHFIKRRAEHNADHFARPIGRAVWRRCISSGRWGKYRSKIDRLLGDDVPNIGTQNLVTTGGCTNDTTWYVPLSTIFPFRGMFSCFHFVNFAAYSSRIAIFLSHPYLLRSDFNILIPPSRSYVFEVCICFAPCRLNESCPTHKHTQRDWYVLVSVIFCSCFPSRYFPHLIL